MCKKYGIVRREVVTDKDIPIEAKGLYGYLSSISDENYDNYPTVKEICCELGISKNSYYKYIKMLQEKEIISKDKESKKWITS